MNRIVGDLEAAPKALQVASIYAPLSRVKKADEVASLQPFDRKILQIRPSPAQDAELKRLNELNRKTEQECNHVNF